MDRPLMFVRFVVVVRSGFEPGLEQWRPINEAERCWDTKNDEFQDI